MDITTNFDLDKKVEHHHHWLLPASIRCIIVGRSNCGKTNLLFNLLLKKGHLNFDRAHLYSKSLGQDKYQLLRDWAEDLKEAAGKEVVTFHSNSDDVIEVDALDPKERSVMLFDDVMNEKQGPIVDFFSRGRHRGADCFYLTQSYFHIPRHGIRENANLFILFPQDVRNMAAIHNTHASVEMPYEEFREFCRQCWSQPYGVAVIDLDRDAFNGKYRCGFDRFYIPKSSI